jgi:anti-sigma-K factor RskA
VSEERAEHEEWDELAAGYALDALEADEELRFTTHLSGCERCQQSVEDHELVAAGLGAIAHPAEASEPPAWETIRSAIISTPQAQPTTLASRRRRYDLSRRTLGAAAAAVAIVGGGVTAWQVATSGTSCAASAGCHTVHLDAGATTAAVLTVRGDIVTMNARRMTPAPSGKIYVLWQQPRDAKPTAITEFSAQPDQQPVTAALQAPYDDTQQFAVSLEQDTGVPPKAPSNLLASGNAT